MAPVSYTHLNTAHVITVHRLIISDTVTLRQVSLGGKAVKMAEKDVYKRQGLKIFIPVPPNTSLAKITENAVATARSHNGHSTGTIIGINRPDTRKPS